MPVTIVDQYAGTLQAFSVQLSLATSVTYSSALATLSSSTAIQQSTAITNAITGSTTFTTLFGSAVTVLVKSYSVAEGGLTTAIIEVSGFTVFKDALTLQVQIVSAVNTALQPSVCSAPCATVTTNLVESAYVDPIDAVSQNFFVTVSQRVAYTWNADLADTSSAAYATAVTAIENALRQSTAFTSLSYTVNVRVTALRQVVVSSGRRRRQASTDTEADVEYSGTADIGTPAVMEQQLIAATEKAAADSNILQGGARITSKISTSAGYKIMASTLILGIIALLLF